MLFVYGTLLSGLGFPMHAKLRARADFVGAGSIPGRLLAISWYPGLVEGAGIVRGELYRPRDEAATLAFLDLYEGCHVRDPEPHEYRRVRRPVNLDGAADVMNAWVYEYIGETAGLADVGGNFREWVQGHRVGTDGTSAGGTNN